jgi:MFS family permease
LLTHFKRTRWQPHQVTTKLDSRDSTPDWQRSMPETDDAEASRSLSTTTSTESAWDKPAPSSGPASGVPEKGQLILWSLIIVAAVANLNLSVANVALPSIGLAFNASQTALDLVAVGYSLGLAASVLWLGALGDRYGRKMMLLLGIGLSIPACLVAAFAPTIEILILARIVGGISAGMAYPTTLALITALWAPGPGRTHSIALWSALGGAIASLGPLVAGFLLERPSTARVHRDSPAGPIAFWKQFGR